MEALIVLLDPILPVFAIMAFGFLLGRAGKTTVDNARTINRFAMTVLLPILVFDLLASSPIHTFSFLPILLYAAVQLVVFVAGYLIALKIFKCEQRESVLLAFCGIFANNAFYVLPIAVFIYGEANVLPIAAVVTLDATVTFGGVMIALQLMETGRASPSTVLLTIAKTPLLQAIFLGVLFSLASLSIPQPVQTFLDFNGAAAAPVALFALGVVLSQIRFRLNGTVITFTIIKLLVFPVLVWLALTGFARGHPQSDLFLLASAGPAGAMAFSLALLHDVRTDMIAQVIVWTTLLTLLTLAILA